MRMTVLVPILALAAAVAACDSTSGPHSGRTTFRLKPASGSGATASMVALDEGGRGKGDHGSTQLTLSDIQSINIHFTDIAALPLSASNQVNEEAAWVLLPPAQPMWINLLALPANGLVVDRDNLPAGTYGDLRLLFDEANIVFAHDVTIDGRTFVAGQPYPLFIGGLNTSSNMTLQDADDANAFGIFVPAATFTVDNNTAQTIDIVFNSGNSLQNVFVIGNGVRLVPVFGATDEDQNNSRGNHNGGDD